MRRVRLSVRVIALTAVACIAVACSSSGGESGGNGNTAAATDSPIPSFTYGLEAIPGTLDVANNYNAPDMAVMGLVTQPLEIANLDGSYTQVLAETVTQPDDLTLVYDLREDATFSDGSPLTPDDVIWTIDHLRGPRTHTVSELANFDTVEATGEHQVTITLKEPNPAQRGSFALISFVQQAKYGEASGEDFGTPAAPPVGTGPYVISSFSASGISLDRNSKYWSEKPAVDSFTFTTIADDNTGQLAMRSGELDGVALLDVKSAPQWASVDGATTWSSPTLYVDYVTMDTTEPPFSDVHVRRAVSYATDAAGLLKANYGDEAKPAIGLTPPQVVAPVEPEEGAFVKMADEAPTYPFSIDDAQAELAQSAYPDGFDVTYEYYSPPGKIVGLSLAENLGKLGIKVELKSRQLNDYLGDLFVGKFPQIGFFSMSAVVPDPSSYYVYMLGKDNPYNAAQFSNDVTNRALTDLDNGDKPARWSAVTDIVQQLGTEVPYVGLAHPNFVFALAGGMTFTQTPDFMQMSSGNWVNLLKSTT